mmetsp:Transcript_36171/g.48952  ORF Transcript_36171/g.48952 Transcript_36171/m.48952 type:complete len:181 (-) Transcript_36171:182-724(-)|eukprot:CAMPEP_0185771510 /NCGR_PEP_ID=MMETSP1174-20130828/64347_1 /TAXON_ID=35687 /ORGANISM="Dictyocha speculum, Strain CCMP1381" /LENGTH=180 /DNA_ID=CAMNT_0028457393 /DNA_START=13 /DNA_END=555 /DNA_ORIENTATION=-
MRKCGMLIKTSQLGTAQRCSSFFNRRVISQVFFSSEGTITPSQLPIHTTVKHPMELIAKQIPITTPASEADMSADQKFAVIRLSGTQYKVTLDDVVVTNRINGCEVADVLKIDDVLLVGSRDSTVIGRPVIPHAQVRLAVEEHTKDKKVIVFKKRRRKNSQRKNGFRRSVTILRVIGIDI